MRKMFKTSYFYHYFEHWWVIVVISAGTWQMFTFYHHRITYQQTMMSSALHANVFLVRLIIKFSMKLDQTNQRYEFMLWLGLRKVLSHWGEVMGIFLVRFGQELLIY